MPIEGWNAAMTESAQSREALELTLVTAADCALCSHGREVLAKLSEELPLRVSEIDLDSAEGKALAERFPLVFPPILIADGAVLSYGRLSEKRLRKELGRGR